MAVPGPVGFWASFLLFALWIGVVAKSHGRQIRLERELQGYFEVDFRSDANPAFVKGLWRRDRRLYWTVASLATGVLLAWVVWQKPHEESSASGPLWAWVALALMSAMVLAFATSGLVSLTRFRRALRLRKQEGTVPDPRWLRAAHRGSWGWWAATLLLGVMVALILLNP